jgi:hypothetical protein
MLKLIAAAALILALPGCGITKPQAATAVSIGAGLCQALLYATDPALEPLCVTAEQIASWTIELANLPPARTAGMPPAYQDRLYQLARSHGAKTVSGK